VGRSFVEGEAICCLLRDCSFEGEAVLHLSREGGGHSPFAKGGRSCSSVERGGCSPFVREGAPFVERGGHYLSREGAIHVKGRLFSVCQFVEKGSCSFEGEGVHHLSREGVVRLKGRLPFVKRGDIHLSREGAICLKGKLFI